MVIIIRVLVKEKYLHGTISVNLFLHTLSGSNASLQLLWVNTGDMVRNNCKTIVKETAIFMSDVTYQLMWLCLDTQLNYM